MTPGHQSGYPVFSNKAGEGPAVMVEVLPLPDLDPPINEDAADACREMVRDTERPDEPPGHSR